MFENLCKIFERLKMFKQFEAMKTKRILVYIRGSRAGTLVIIAEWIHLEN